MKQKLPKKKSLYKNLYLDEIQKIKNLQNPWTQWSLIRLFIALFFKKRHIINLFDFQILTSLVFRGLYNSNQKKTFLLNILVFFTLPFFFYILNNKTIVKQQNFDLRKIQKQNFYKKNDRSICKNNFHFLNTKFDIFLHNFFSFQKEKKWYKTSFLNLNEFCDVLKRKEKLNLHSWKFLVLEQINSNWKISEESLSKIKVLLEKKNIDDLKDFFEFYFNHKLNQNNSWEYYFYSLFLNQLNNKKKKNYFSYKNSIGFEVFLAFCEKLLFEVEFLSKQKNKNLQIQLNFFEKFAYLDIFGKKIFQNLQNFDESEKKLVESYFLLKNKGNFYFHNYIEFTVWQLYKNNYLNLKQKNSLKDFNEFNKLNHFEFFLNVEDFYSDYIYKFSKYILYERKKSNKKITKSFSNQIYYKKLNSVFNLNTYCFFDSNNFLFDWIKKNFYINNKPFIKSLIIYSSISNQSALFSKRKNEIFFSKFLLKNSIKKNNKYLITKIFSKENKTRINNFPKSICYAFFEILSINEIDNQFYLKKNLKNKKLKELNLNKRKNSDSFRLQNLWKTKNYSENFLLNCSFLLNPTYKIIQQDNYLRKKNTLFSKFVYLFYFIFYKYKKLNIFLKFVILKKRLKKRNETLNVSIQILNKVYKKKFNENAKYKIKSQILQSTKKLKKNINKKTLLETNFFIILNKIKYQIQFSQNKKIINFNNSSRKLTNLLKKYYLENNDLIKKNLINKNLITWKKVANNLFISNIEYTKIYFNKKNIQFFYFSKKIVLEAFYRNKKSCNTIIINFENLKEFQFNLKKIQNILNWFSLFFKSNNPNFNKIKFSKIPYFINENLTTNFCFNDKDFNAFVRELFKFEMNNEFLLKFFKKFLHYKIYKNKEILFNSVENKENKQLLQTFFEKKNFLTFVDFLQNAQLNYNNRFLFYLENKNSNDFNLLYLRLLKIFLKYKKSDLFINEIIFLKKKNKNFFVQSKLSNVLLVKNSYKIFDKTKILFFSDFLKLKNYWIPTKLYNFSNVFSFHFFKQKEKKFEIFLNDQYVFERTSLRKKKFKLFIQKTLQPNINHIDFKPYYKIFFFKLLNNFNNNNYKILKWIDEFIFYSKKLNYKNHNKIEKKNNNTTFFSKKNKIKTINFFSKKIFLKLYNSWFFTLEWWEYNIYILLQIIQEGFFQVKDFFDYLISKNNKIIGIKISLKTLSFNNSILKWNLRFFNEINYRKNHFFNFVWSDFLLINNYNNLHWVIFSLVAFIFLYCQKTFSVFIGSDFFYLWKKFEIIQYLTDPSRSFYFTKLIRRNKTRLLNKTENLLTYFFQNLAHYITNIQFYLLTKKNLTKWLINNQSLDLSRRKRKLLVQSLITYNKIKNYKLESNSNIQFFNSYFGYQITNQQGLLYFQYLAEFFQKNLMNNPLDLANKWIVFAFWQKIFSSQTLWQTKKFELSFQNTPVPLQFGLSYSKGILLIGPIETGRSYLIKNLAAESYVPLFKISINKLLYNKPDVITESWMSILIESLRRLNLTLDFAKKMSPCIIWVQNVHQLNVNRLTQNVESDPTFLLGILLKYFQTDLSKTKKYNIILIGSTHLPKKVDPALISPNRLDKIINVRLFNISQRKKQFPLLLKKKNFQFKKNLFFLNEFGSRTMGYNLRDLAALTNEVLLISITKNKSFIDSNTLKFAFHRQIFGLTYTNNKLKFEKILKIVIYKLGKTIIQNILIKYCSMNLVNIGNFLWKKKFYYLSKWYLESSLDESIIKELTILTHILGCLAGTAAQDSWLLIEKKEENSLPIDKLVENDFTLAFSILESFFSEFPWLEICQNNFVNYKKNKKIEFPTKNSLNIMQNGIFAITNKKFIYTQNDLQNKSSFSQQIICNKKKIYEFKNTFWSPRFWRLSFFRSHLFDWIKRPNDFEFSYQFGFSKRKEYLFSANLQKKNNYGQFIEKKKKEQLLYERILPRIRRRNVQELESQFEEILLEEQFEILGFFQLSAQFPMEYQLYNKPRLFIGKRILWDPIGLFFQIRHFVFSRREFFVDEEILRRLYVTYGARRERERSRSSQKIKQFFLCRGYNKDLISKLSIRWWNQLPIHEEQNIDTLKRIEHIGIQLKRPQIFTPVYLYQRWLIENSPEKFFRFELLNHRQKWLKLNSLLLNDSFIYTTLLESYKYLLHFFTDNQKLLKQMTKILLKKGWLFENEIENIIYKTKK
uniref:Protein Ycf2 n=1 Tax=Dumortiera hirsuta TaxID=56917 RepID=A0A346M0P7_DUMHI|nr:protein Ycf2 [Dumortiera hirsuta]AXQ02592.1 protein Ycf2 [Dumortiera hirsuta]